MIFPDTGLRKSWLFRLAVLLFVGNSFEESSARPFLPIAGKGNRSKAARTDRRSSALTDPLMTMMLQKTNTSSDLFDPVKQTPAEADRAGKSRPASDEVLNYLVTRTLSPGELRRDQIDLLYREIDLNSDSAVSFLEIRDHLSFSWRIFREVDLDTDGFWSPAEVSASIVDAARRRDLPVGAEFAALPMPPIENSSEYAFGMREDSRLRFTRSVLARARFALTGDVSALRALQPRERRPSTGDASEVRPNRRSLTPTQRASEIAQEVFPLPINPTGVGARGSWAAAKSVTGESAPPSGKSSSRESSSDQ